MFDDVATGSWILNLTVLVQDSVDDDEIKRIADRLVVMGKRAGYPVDVVDHDVDGDGHTRIYVDVPFDTFDDEDVENVSLSVIEDLQYYVPWDVIGDNISERNFDEA